MGVAEPVAVEVTSPRLERARARPAPHSLRGLWGAGRRNKKALIGGILIVAVVFCGLFAGLISPYDPTAQEVVNRNQPPIGLGGSADHLLGTDGLGRDILSRLIYGAQVSLIVGVSAVLLQGGIGVAAGLVAGYYGGWIDKIIMRLADIQLAVPFLVLALALVAVIGPGLVNIIVALGLTGWVLYGRTARGEVLSLREREFIQAARVLGATGGRIMWRHIFPNITASLLVIGSLQVARMIIFEASLSYLGLGVPPPTPTWGGMVADGRDVLTIAWWVSTIPGLAIALTVLGINLMGDFLRDALDPRLRL